MWPQGDRSGEGAPALPRCAPAAPTPARRRRECRHRCYVAVGQTTCKTDKAERCGHRTPSGAVRMVHLIAFCAVCSSTSRWAGAALRAPAVPRKGAGHPCPARSHALPVCLPHLVDAGAPLEEPRSGGAARLERERPIAERRQPHGDGRGWHQLPAARRREVGSGRERKAETCKRRGRAWREVRRFQRVPPIRGGLGGGHRSAQGVGRVSANLVGGGIEGLAKLHHVNT